MPNNRWRIILAARRSEWERAARYFAEMEPGNAIFPFSWVLTNSEFVDLRRTESYKQEMKTAGFLEYWRAQGWADNCRAVGADDFECDFE